MLEQSHSKPPNSGVPPGLDTIWRRAADRLRQSGLPSAELDARLLLEHVCEIDHETVIREPERPLNEAQAEIFERLLRRRLKREPVARITGVRSFWKHDFRLAPETLDPRPDTETLIEAALSLISEAGGRQAPLDILDLGTGSGCLLLSLLVEAPGARGLGTDISAAALACAKANAGALGLGDRVGFLQADWLDTLRGSFDLIVTNPPYIPTNEIDALAPEVAGYDPRHALDGGADGLEAYRKIIASLARVLAPGGWAILEVGDGQAPALRELLADANFEFAADGFREFADLSGKIRCVAVMQR